MVPLQYHSFLLSKFSSSYLMGVKLAEQQQNTRWMAVRLGIPGCASTRKVKPIWIILIKQWHHLKNMQICTSLQTYNHTSTSPQSQQKSRNYSSTNLGFLQCRCVLLGLAQSLDECHRLALQAAWKPPSNAATEERHKLLTARHQTRQELET